MAATVDWREMLPKAGQIPSSEEFVSLLSQLASVQKLLADNDQMDAAEVIEVVALQLAGLVSFFIRMHGKTINPLDVENTIH